MVSIDLGYFYHLVDLRNKLLVMPADEALPSTVTNHEWQELLRG